METTQASITFVVRVRPGGRDRVSGIVERVKTGEKRRFHGAEAIGPLIAGMLRQETRDTPGGAPDRHPGAT